MLLLRLIFPAFVAVAIASCSKTPTLPEPVDRQFSQEVIDLNNQGLEQLRGQEHEKALSLFDKAIAIDPEYHVALANKAQLLVTKKRYADACTCFETLVSLRPRTAEYYVGRAFCLARLAQPRKARAV